MATVPYERMFDHSGDGILPAFVLGWDTIPAVDAPPFMVEVDHQYGGLACLQAILSGLVLPLHENTGRAKRDPGPLFEAFRSAAESQRHVRKLPSTEPLVDAWTGSHGERMTELDLHNWDAMLAKWYALPPLEAGAEAWLSFAALSPRAFLGWVALETNEDREISPTHIVTEDTLRAFTGATPPRHTAVPARLYLLWESSD